MDIIGIDPRVIELALAHSRFVTSVQNVYGMLKKDAQGQSDIDITIESVNAATAEINLLLSNGLQVDKAVRIEEAIKAESAVTIDAQTPLEDR